jgi:uncharacterized protein YbaA (DUF1428 family)
MKKGAYIDGFVLSIPKGKTSEYKKIAKEALEVWTKFGALDYKECIIDDPAPPYVAFTFQKMAKAKSNEAVWFSFITFKSRAHRDSVNKKVMAFFEHKYGKDQMKMPFDVKRFSYAGFNVEVGM